LIYRILSTRSIAKVAKVLNKTEDATFYQERSWQITQSLLDHFWDKDREIFDELYLELPIPFYTEKVLCRSRPFLIQFTS
jgi:hypothetical protein